MDCRTFDKHNMEQLVAFFLFLDHLSGLEIRRCGLYNFEKFDVRTFSFF